MINLMECPKLAKFSIFSMTKLLLTGLHVLGGAMNICKRLYVLKTTKYSCSLNDQDMRFEYVWKGISIQLSIQVVNTNNNLSVCHEKRLPYQSVIKTFIHLLVLFISIFPWTLFQSTWVISYTFELSIKSF